MWRCCGSPVCGQAAEKEAELLRYQQDDAALDALLAQEATEEEAAAVEGAEPPPKRRYSTATPFGGKPYPNQIPSYFRLKREAMERGSPHPARA